ncbi:uncharacterized protein LOC142255712 [Anomaloglossus baeobatrachus]|uniref:uncharacterized protein LOC142255712 n=1 Tax=Anomaloglossus baeobatrachus TaxID=238106 RepID=UPI003F506384
MFLVILSFFSLVMEGYSMSCISCFNGNVTNCSGGSISCPENNECLSMFLKITINGSTSGNFFRSCAPKNQCNITESSSFSGGTMEMAATCCSETDMCTPADPQLPSTNSTQPNGRVCTMCQSINSDGCDTKNTMSCYGNESMCIHFTTTTTAHSEIPQCLRVNAISPCVNRKWPIQARGSTIPPTSIVNLQENTSPSLQEARRQRNGSDSRQLPTP